MLNDPSLQEHLRELAREVIAQDIEAIGRHVYAVPSRSDWTCPPRGSANYNAMSPIEGMLRFIVFEPCDGMHLERVSCGTKTIGEYQIRLHGARSLTIGGEYQMRLHGARLLLFFEPILVTPSINVSVLVTNESAESQALRYTAFLSPKREHA